VDLCLDFYIRTHPHRLTLLLALLLHADAAVVFFIDYLDARSVQDVNAITPDMISDYVKQSGMAQISLCYAARAFSSKFAAFRA